MLPAVTRAAASKPVPPRTGLASSLRASFTSWRTACVTLQQFPSGLPLGMVITAVPAWLALEGVDVKTIGFVTLAQAPWTFKFLWSPLMDRYAPPFLGRKRGWALLSQIALFVTTMGLAGAAAQPQHVWIVAAATCLVAFAAASQDIAIDAYAVEVLRPEEQGPAAGARTAISRLAFFLSGRVVITAAKYLSWPALFAFQALAYLPSALVTALSPEPEERPAPPRTLKDAVWDPFVAFLRQHRAVEIALFLVLYKFGDNLASSLVSPFLIQAGYDKVDVGVASGTIGLVFTIVGSLAGGAITAGLGLGHSLWLFGLLQAFSNLGYVAVAQSGVNRPLMYSAMAVETLTTGMGTGAFSVLLLRLTQKRFSATQYALLSSIFALGRTVAGPMAGVAVDALGWSTFFFLTIAAAAPGLILLQRFVPLGVRDPVFTIEPAPAGPPPARAALVRRGLAGLATGLAVGIACSASLDAARSLRAGRGFDLVTPLSRLVSPSGVDDLFTLVAIGLFAATCGIASAALVAARGERS